MVSTNSESRRDILRRELIEGVTQCGWVIDQVRPCEVIHGTVLPSVDGRTAVVHRFEQGMLREDGVPVPLCSMCVWRARRFGKNVMPYDKVLQLFEQAMLDGMNDAPPAAPIQASTRVMIPAATPMAPPAPVMPAVGRVPAVRKDALISQPAPRTEERKPEVARGPDPRSPRGHYTWLEKSRGFNEAFVLKTGGLCSCGECDEKSGKGFVTRSGEHKGKQYPLCPVAINAALGFYSARKRADRKPGFLVFKDQADWKRFDESRSQRTQDDAIRGHAVLEGEFTLDTENCVVTMCKASKPTDRIARIVDGKVVEHKICGRCAVAARKLCHQMRDEGKRWDFHLLREGEKLSEKHMQNLRNAARLIAAQKQAASKPPKGKGKGKPEATKPSGSFGQVLNAALEKGQAKKAKAATPQVEPAPSEPETTEPTPESTTASIPVVAPETATSTPQEDAVGGGSN